MKKFKLEECKIIQINFDYFSKFDERTIIKFMIMDEERYLMERKIRNTMIRSAEIDAEKRGHLRGIEKGLQEGIDKGIQQGIKENQKQIVINMLNNNYALEQIKQITGLSENEINLIKENNNK